MKNKLISMVEFVQIASTKPDHFDNMCNCISYMHFLRTPLNISQFVPAIEVDGKWEVLLMPEKPSRGSSDVLYAIYQQAKDKVVFEGFDIEEYKGVYTLIHLENTKYWTFSNFNDRFKSLGLETIQDLIKYNPTLTTYGMELSGLNQ
jgi:hypothetical protein